MKHWDVFLQYYLMLTQRLCAGAASLFLWGSLSGFAETIPWLGARIALSLVFGALAFEGFNQLVARYYRPYFARKGLPKAARVHSGKTQILDAEDYEFRAKSERLILTVLLYFGFCFLMSLFFGETRLRRPFQLRSAYGLFGLIGAFAALDLFFGVVVWSGAAPRSGRSRAKNQWAIFWGTMLQIPGWFYVVGTILYFCLVESKQV